MSVIATLTLLNSKVRESNRVVGTYGDDENYRSDHLAVEAITASTAQNDSGRFQLDSRDEKYLPFEGAGAISRWRIELPRKFRSLDYDTISDVVLQLNYTARLSLPARAIFFRHSSMATTGNLENLTTPLRLVTLRHAVRDTASLAA